MRKGTSAFFGTMMAKIAGATPSVPDEESLADHVVILGDSIMARTHYTTQYPDPTTKQAGFITSNASEKIKAHFDTNSANYRRYDHPDAIEIPSTGWAATTIYGGDASRNSESYRRTSGEGDTRFVVPADNKYFNWVANWKSSNNTACTVVISEGNGYAKIYNNGVWVEANGFVFNHNSSLFGGGNIWYARRYFKKFDGITQAVTITIEKSGTTDDINYWGWEYANEPMNVIVCEARGGHVLLSGNSEVTGNPLGALDQFQDQAFSSLRPMPQLVILEIPLINMLYHYTSDNPTQMWNRVNTFCFGNDPFSLKTKTNNFANTQLLIFTAHLTSDDVNTDGTIKTRIAADSQTYSKKDYHDEIITQLNALGHSYMHVVDMHQQFFDYGEANYGGNYYTAISGNLCVGDRIHLSDLGSQKYYDFLLPTLNTITL